MDSHNILHERHVALPIEIVAMTKGCMLLRYQSYILTSYEFVDDFQMGVSIDFGNYGYALSLPGLFVVLQQIYFRHHGIDASALHSGAGPSFLFFGTRVTDLQEVPAQT